MQCLFYIHGTPNGQRFWGAEEDREYIRSFYAGDKEENIRFVIEISPQKQRTYFTYLHCKNFFGANNRPGAYFGLTLGVDSLVYCKDTTNLYKLFDQIYTQGIANGTIVAKQGNNEIYRISSFEEKQTELERIQQTFIKTFTESFVNKGDICTIDSQSLTFTKSAVIEKYNLSDVDNAAFRATLLKHGKVYVSPEYPTKDDIIARIYQQINPEKEKSEHLNEEYGKLQEKYKSLSYERDSLKQKANELATTEQQLRSTLQDKNKHISDLEQKNRELEKERAKKRLEDIVAKIYPSIQDLQETMRKLVRPSYEERGDSHKQRNISSLTTWIPIVLSALSFLLLIFITIVLLRPAWFSKAPKTTKATSMVEVTQKPLSVHFGVPNDCKIERDSTYTAFVQNCQGNVEWKVDGFEIVSGSKPEKRIAVRATDKDTAILSLYVAKKKQWSQLCIVKK